MLCRKWREHKERPLARSPSSGSTNDADNAECRAARMLPTRQTKARERINGGPSVSRRVAPFRKPTRTESFDSCTRCRLLSFSSFFLRFISPPSVAIRFHPRRIPVNELPSPDAVYRRLKGKGGKKMGIESRKVGGEIKWSRVEKEEDDDAFFSQPG